MSVPAPRSPGVEVQRATSRRGLPASARIQGWAGAALEHCGHGEGELVVRLVDAEEGAALNRTYRRKAGPTNVLAFPFEPPPGVTSAHLGDVVLCVPVAIEEARAQRKPLAAHLAHLVVHGTLHLLGLEHGADAEARAMEELEIQILARLGYSNPYVF